MAWSNIITKHIVELLNNDPKTGDKFTLKNLAGSATDKYAKAESMKAELSSICKTPYATICRELQIKRDNGYIKFITGKVGIYEILPKFSTLFTIAPIKPVVAQPVVTQPVVTQPVITQPVVTHVDIMNPTNVSTVNIICNEETRHGSKAELIVEDILNDLKEKDIIVHYKREVVIGALDNSANRNIRLCRLDFLITLPNCIQFAIETDGQQHTTPVGHWGGNLGLFKRQTHDYLKNQWCYSYTKRLPLHIPHTMKDNIVITQFIKDYIKYTY